MTIAGLLILGFGLFLLTLGSIPWLASQKGKLQTFRALRNRNFRWFWFNGATQSMAQGMQFLVLGFLVLDITASSYQLGLVIFAFGLPNLIFAMLGVLLYSSIMKTFFLPVLWTLEMAQFLMVAYYMLGGGYSMQMDSHVRMDLRYSHG